MTNPPLYARLWAQVLIAVALGAALGVFYPSTGAALQPLGEAFVKAIRMLIAPIIFCSIVHGVAQMADVARVGRVAIKSLVYFELMTTVALVFGLVAVNFVAPGQGMHVDVATLDAHLADPYLKQVATVGIVPFLMNILPNTLVGAFAEGNVLQVVLLSLLAGFALVGLGEAGWPITSGIEVISKLVFRMVQIVMRFAPLGVFGAMAFTVGKFGIGSLASLGKLIVEFYAVCIIFIVVALGSVARLTGFSLWRLIRYISDEILVCIATTSSETVLPNLMLKLENAGCDEGIVGLVVPLGYSFNLDGTCLYLASVVVFLAQATDTSLPLSDQIGLLLILLVTSKGAAGVAGAAFVVLAATLAAHPTIPVASVSLVLGIHRLMSQGLTPTNYIGNAVAGIAISKWERALDEEKLAHALDGVTKL
jgi:aerobic C4-dicarboxylate transport protein